MKKTIKPQYYLVPAAICLLAIAILANHYFFAALSTSKETQYIYIDDDDTTDSIYAKLKPFSKTGALSGLGCLAQYSNYGEHIRTGRYAIEPGEGALTVLRRLRNGQQSPVRLTIPEARTTDRLAGVLARKLMLDSATVASALADSAFCASLGYDTCTVPCLFVADTYEVFWNTPLDKLMKRLKREHDRFWNAERQSKAEAAGLTPNEVCTLASIVDEETANLGEKPMVAGMYINRLRQDMPLQADPTVKFALKDFAARRIYRKMLDTPSPYNTYRNTGLPPGPIKIASSDGIDAVLNHEHHDYLYMCAKEDFSGTHNFARTYQEHLQNAARYSKALNQRGIK
jgi:UPF0755 protein